MKMPILDGFEFLDFFNKLSFPGKNEIKIVVLSSSKRIDETRKAMALGATTFLVKPLNKDKVNEILERHW